MFGPRGTFVYWWQLCKGRRLVASLKPPLNVSSPCGFPFGQFCIQTGLIVLSVAAEYDGMGGGVWPPQEVAPTAQTHLYQTHLQTMNLKCELKSNDKLKMKSLKV